jgi:hypothetical protein
MPRRLVVLVALLALSCTAGTARATGGAAEPVTEWNEVAARAVSGPACLSPATDPIHESRIYAITHLAVHDALNAIERRSRPYAYAPAPSRKASADAAVAAAAHDVLVALLPELPGDFAAGCAPGLAVVEAEYAGALAALPAGRFKDLGVHIGQAAAAAILAIRRNDGAAEAPLADPAYPQGTLPGEYRFTPGQTFAFLPTWGSVTPFVLRHAEQFRPPPPYEVGSRRYARDFEEVKRLGGDGAPGGTPSARTDEQTEMARFWIENSPLQWNRIARTVAASERLDSWQAARLLGLLNIALADGYVATFAAKYHYRFWRPVTAIRAADTDGNPRTDADPTWTPLAPTPPIPEHDSGHSVEGGAAAQVLERFFGTDHTRVAICSFTLPAGSTCDDSAAVRTYERFSQARDENAESRILMGWHFRKAVEDGTRHGTRIGDLAVDQTLIPVP